MSWLNSLFAQKKKIPEAFCWYAESIEKDLLKKPLKEIRFVALDTETTGLNPKNDHILSIGAISIKNYQLKIEDSFEVILEQDNQNNEAITIHEITPGISKAGASKKESLQAFLKYLDNAVIIGHNVDFDYKILSKAYYRNFEFSLLNKSYDTVKMVKRVDTHFSESSLHKPQELSLENLCKRYHVEINDRHTAMGDAMATALLFTKLLKRLEHRKVRTLKELLAR